jgi:dTMP kinase
MGTFRKVDCRVAIFITLDGVDGGGKSTQVRMLCDWLTAQGKSCRSFRDPGSTPLGEALRDILLHREEVPLAPTAEMLLYMASRAQLVHEQLQPALAECDYVITDRYLLANVVYQGAAGGLDPETLWQVGRIATAGLEPDLTIVLDLPIEVAAARIDRSRDRLESRGEDYFQRVRLGFLEHLPRAGKKSLVIDASQPIEAIHAQITAAVDEL